MADDELKRLLQESAAETQRHFDETANRLVSETRHHFDETANRLIAENRHHFDVAMESNRHEIGLIAEKVIRLDEMVTRLDENVVRLDEKLDKTATNLAQRIEQTAAETQAMIKFSHAELDRRLRTVEESVSDLQARVERIESSTH